jgi:zinc transport system substrate-binding protein
MKGILSILVALLLSGCGEKHDSGGTDNRPVVFVSIMPQVGLAKAVAGELAEIHALVGEGRSPHSYAPTGRQLARLGEADALLTIGEPFEKQLLHKISPLYPELSIVPSHAGIARRAMPHMHHSKACAQSHGEMDPHVWLCPANAAAIAKNMAAALEQIDPANAEAYRKNYDDLERQLRRLDMDIRELLKPYNGSRFYVFHPSFGYFADTYGLEQVPVELDGKSPSPRQLATLIEQAKADGVKVVFVQKQFPAGSAKAIADALNGRVVQLDPLAEDSVASLWLIAESIAQALK